MATYESSPTMVEAYQWFESMQTGDGIFQDAWGFYVVTAHKQKVYVVDGDWIVKEPTGDGYYPVKDEIFKKRWKLKC